MEFRKYIELDHRNKSAHVCSSLQPLITSETICDECTLLYESTYTNGVYKFIDKNTDKVVIEIREERILGCYYVFIGKHNDIDNPTLVFDTMEQIAEFLNTAH